MAERGGLLRLEFERGEGNNLPVVEARDRGAALIDDAKLQINESK